MDREAWRAIQSMGLQRVGNVGVVEHIKMLLEANAVIPLDKTGLLQCCPSCSPKFSGERSGLRFWRQRADFFPKGVLFLGGEVGSTDLRNLSSPGRDQTQCNGSVES